ncbi:hypothetical protein EOPP23_01030 [Endozoicomonas sp. OPT23]|uniref:hypothetical protein n=1 Tax=Endozoicomonas sp. OPT23 TaxID=2072845 RepID=UPI00129A94F1|nr:hypothetical protein [Endozoicomonas sp. OPT23]MRI31575.1 hypothetical protein [Endozoicomonas sp. OPT23]
MSEMIRPCATIVSDLNVENEALKAFYISLTCNQSVDDYIVDRHIHFSSRHVEGTFLSHLLALTELALDRCVFREKQSGLAN